MELDKLYNRDCISGMAEIREGSVDLAFADPPFNIGYTYDVYEDRLAANEYLAWTKQWGAAVVRALKPTGSFWLAIGDDFAAELKVLFQRELGLFCRSWVIWYYTFGVNCKFKFSRSHTHLFHFVKDPKNFTFNADAIRVPSARQLVYADSRADSKGRLPDDTWILRPQDAEGSFSPEEDVWYFPRVCGTFKERAGWHGCQMPEQLLGRIIKSCSNPGETILEPFGGSGTTLAVAKKLDRRFIGFELSKNYAEQIRSRLKAVSSGDPLLGAEEPQVSAPQTASRKSKRVAQSPAPIISIPQRSNVSDVNRGIVEAFFATRNGFPVDRVIADPELNEQFATMCVRLGLPGEALDWNQRLMNLRKAGHFKGLPRSSRTAIPFGKREFYRYRFACEIAAQKFTLEHDATLDHILCDPKLASLFDRFVGSMLPDNLSSLKIRWFALRLRKMRNDVREAAKKIETVIGMPREHENPFSIKVSSVPAMCGLYWLSEVGRKPGGERSLYVGETKNLRERMEDQFGHPGFGFWDTPRENLQIAYQAVDDPAKLLGHQSLWISKLHPIGNYQKLAI